MEKRQSLSSPHLRPVPELRILICTGYFVILISWTKILLGSYARSRCFRHNTWPDIPFAKDGLAATF
jgi:hypothetical protein